MREEIRRFCEEYQYPAEAVHSLLDVCHKVEDSPELKELFNRAESEYAKNPSIDYAGYLDSIKRVCGEESLSWESVSLLFHICLVPMLYRHYEERGLPAGLCRASMEDLKWKLLECRQVYGIWGSFVPDWFAGFFKITRFTLGRLQFELTSFPEDYEASGRRKPTGVRHAVNIHIPSGAPLLHDDCIRSYRLAADFFRDAFQRVTSCDDRDPGNVFFVCDSWLLYPPHRDFLPAHSRILEFMNDFDIYASRTDPDGSDLWRIFGRADCSDTVGLPEETSLQRAYKHWLMSGRTPGIGRGLFRLDR